MGIWRLVMETNRLSRPSGYLPCVSQPFQILGRFPFWPLNLGTNASTPPGSSGPRAERTRRGSHRSQGARTGPCGPTKQVCHVAPALGALRRRYAFWGVLGAFWACSGPDGPKTPHRPNDPRCLGCRLRATVKLLTMGIWRLVVETKRLSRPPGCPPGVSQPFHILGRCALIGLCRQIENPQIAITSPKK